MPCILQTKKRYVGFMYETLDQSEPVFDAKGIETVRRDGCPAVGKVTKSKRIYYMYCMHTNSVFRLSQTFTGH